MFSRGGHYVFSFDNAKVRKNERYARVRRNHFRFIAEVLKWQIDERLCTSVPFGSHGLAGDAERVGEVQISSMRSDSRKNNKSTACGQCLVCFMRSGSYPGWSRVEARSSVEVLHRWPVGRCCRVSRGYVCRSASARRQR